MKISLFPEKLHLIILGIHNETIFVIKKNPYDLEQELWVQIRVQTVLKDVINFWNKMTIDY